MRPSLWQVEIRNPGKKYDSPILATTVNSAAMPSFTVLCSFCAGLDGAIKEILCERHLFGPQSKAQAVLNCDAKVDLTPSSKTCWSPPPLCPTHAAVLVGQLFVNEGFLKRRVMKYWTAVLSTNLQEGDTFLQMYKAPMDLKAISRAVPKKHCFLHVNIAPIEE